MLAMFDLDNTLVDRQGAVARWAREFAVEHGLPDATASWIVEIDRDGYRPRRQVFDDIRERCGLLPTTDELLARYRERVVELTETTPGAIECLRHLRTAGWTLVIVTNGSTRQQHAKIDVLGLRSLVDGVVVSDEVGVAKPDASIYRIAAEAVGAEPTGGWMVGDSPANDIVAPRRIGLRTVWLRRGRAWNPDLPPPDRTIDSLTELVATSLS